MSKSATIPEALEDQLNRLENCRGIAVVNTTTGGGIANKSILEHIDKAELLVRGRTR